MKFILSDELNENSVFSMETLKELPIEAFGKWFDNVEGKLKLIYNCIKRDLDGYAKQSGANILAFHQIRIKEKNSFIDKIDSIRKNQKQLEEFYKDELMVLKIQDIIHDLIGARLVMYFFIDTIFAINYFDHYPIFGIENVNVYMLQLLDSPLGGDKYNLTKRLQEINRSLEVKKKDSGYESIHLIIRYQEPYATQRELFYISDHSKEYGDELQKNSEITLFPIEIQIRTILQHTWAQIEHLMNYSLIKSASEEPVNDDYFKEEFRCQKAFLFSVEYHQRLIYDRFCNFRKMPLPLSNTGSIEISEIDLCYFDDEDKSKIREINKRMDGGESKILLNDLRDLIEEIEHKYDKDFLSLTHEKEIHNWAKKRLFLELLGYVLLNGGLESREQVDRIFSGRFKKMGYDQYVNEIILYEFVRYGDKYFLCNPRCLSSDRILVSDPLLFYRLAGAYIKIGDFKRGIYMLNEVLEKKYLEIYPKVKGSEIILNKKHMLRRIGEYYHFAYLKHGLSNHGDLDEACNFMEQAYFSDHAPMDDELRFNEQGKILSNLVVLYFSRYILQKFPNQDGFNRKIGPLIPDISKHFELEQIRSMKKVHAMEAKSIYYYFIGSIEAARELISECRNIVQENAKNPLFKIMTNKIYEFMYYLNDNSTGPSI